MMRDVARPEVARSAGTRAFSVSTRREFESLMEMSGFSETQMQVRDAVSKICGRFPDVSILHFQVFEEEEEKEEAGNVREREGRLTR